MTRRSGVAIEGVAIEDAVADAGDDDVEESGTAMKNLGQMMKQAQRLQEKMGELQEQLAQAELMGSSGGGMVEVTVNGKGEVRKLKIDRSLVDPEEVEVLEDLIVAACNDAKAKLEAHVAEKMAEVTGGLKLPPGMSLPF